MMYDQLTKPRDRSIDPGVDNTYYRELSRLIGVECHARLGEMLFQRRDETHPADRSHCSEPRHIAQRRVRWQGTGCKRDAGFTVGLKIETEALERFDPACLETSSVVQYPIEKRHNRTLRIAPERRFVGGDFRDGTELPHLVLGRALNQLRESDQ